MGNKVAGRSQGQIPHAALHGRLECFLNVQHICIAGSLIFLINANAKAEMKGCQVSEKFDWILSKK